MPRRGRGVCAEVFRPAAIVYRAVVSWLARLFGVESDEARARRALDALRLHPRVPETGRRASASSPVDAVEPWKRHVDAIARARHRQAIPVLAQLASAPLPAALSSAVFIALLVMEDSAADAALRAVDVTRATPFARSIVGLSRLRDVDALVATAAAAEQGFPSAIQACTLAFEGLAMALRNRGSTEPWGRPFLEELGDRQAQAIALAARLRTNDDLAAAARRVLLALTPEARRDLLSDAPSGGPVTDSTSPYRAPVGGVSWEGLATARRVDLGLRREALAVARDRMKLVRERADIVTARLEAEGWPLREDARRAGEVPDPAVPGPFLGEVLVERVAHEARTRGDVDATIAAIEEAIGGHVPIVLEAFWREVGQIDWTPRRGAPLPEWVKEDLGLFDPLCVLGLPAALVAIDDWRLWTAQSAEPALEDPLAILVTPDRSYAKGSVLDAYEIRIPSDVFDPPLLHAPQGTTLAGHLATALAHGGFPGLARLDRMKKRHRTVVDALTKGLPRVD